MKTEGQVKRKLAQVRFRHLKREIRNGLSKKSVNCKFNDRIDIPGHEGVGICLYRAGDPDHYTGGMCDEAHNDRAAQCPYFECRNSKDKIREDFMSFVSSADRAHIAERYPDMAALLWVLEADTSLSVDDAQDDGEEDEPEEPTEEPPAPEPTAIVVRSSWDRTMNVLRGFWDWLTGRMHHE